MALVPVILAGGVGSRLWPLSRSQFPKQVLDLVSGDTLLQATASRVGAIADQKKGGAPIVVCNEEHRFLIAEQLRQIGVENPVILLEPVGRNTAPSVTLSALYASDYLKKDDVLLIMPADHIIHDTDAFHEAIREGYDLALKSQMVTFGIVADRPHTGYGYIEKGTPRDNPQGKVTCHAIEKFVEKPDEATAKSYVDSGNYYWNAGLFMVKASVWLNLIETYAEDISQACNSAWQGRKNDGIFLRIDEETFERCRDDSIDYAVMENLTADDAAEVQSSVIPLDAGWSDLGDWPAVWEQLPQDQDNNAVKGDVYLEDCQNSLVHASHRLVAAVGLQNMIVVETSDAILVMDSSKAQQVKEIVKRLKQDGRDESASHRRVYRPWGSYESLDSGARFQVKRIMVNPGASLSLQMHHHRAEHWIVVTGTAEVSNGDNVFLLTENQSTYIPIGVKHRLANPGTIPLELIEVQSGTYLGEDDIVRFQDVYGRS